METRFGLRVPKLEVCLNWMQQDSKTNYVKNCFGIFELPLCYSGISLLLFTLLLFFPLGFFNEDSTTYIYTS